MKFIFYLLFFATTIQLNAQTGISVPQMTQADVQIKNFMTTYAIPGLTFAMAKDGKIVYMRAFGYSDVAKTIPTQPNNLFRIASVSKQITSIAIMKLMQDGQLNMADKVFGPGGLLEHDPIVSTAVINDNRIFDITVQQLLEHSEGWDRGVNCNPSPTPPYPYYFSGCDPINNPLSVSLEFGISNPVSEPYLCKYLLQKGLNFAPGTKYAYSNIGYLCLGQIIEQLSGKSYEEYVKTAILAPLGIYDMHIGKNLLSDKLEREVEYTGGEGTNLSVYGTGQQAPWEYGGMNVTAMSAHGGWITTARDLLTLLNAVDGFATKPDILTPATVTVMTTPSATNINYAKGWAVNSSNNWWHTGAIPGTACEQVRTSGGYTWVVIMSKRSNATNFWSAVDNLGWNIITATATWPTWDLMLAPTQNASGIAFSNITAASMTVNWTNGNGGKRLLTVSPQAINAFPKDGTDYTANADYAAAGVIGGNVKVVYNGNGNSVTVTGLEEDKKYYFRLMEYNNSAATGNNSLYLLGNNAIDSQSTQSSLPLTLIGFDGHLSGNNVLLNWATSQEINTSHFEIERSNSGTSFTKVDEVTAAGNSSIKRSYQFTDHNVFNLPKVYYRLKMVDKDGKFTYSKVVFVDIASNSKIIISPNPAKSVININDSKIVKVEVFGMTGIAFITESFNRKDDIQLDVSRLSDGVYMVKITDADAKSSIQRVVIQK